ncbi:MAG: TIGR00159 family protein [Tissierellia bacterium]|nr:TIGR00159 family protein [Tissierellia bacterium]
MTLVNTFMESIGNLINNVRIQDIIDIIVVAYIFYKIFILIKETRAEQLIKGIVLFLILTLVSGWLELYTLSWILNKAMTAGAFALLVVFQPELRRALERLGRIRVLNKSLIDSRGESLGNLVKEISNAVASLSRQKIGAIMVIERQIGLNDIIESGTLIDGLVTSDLLINIFIPNTPLHDGAVIIRDDKIRAAACFLPLSDNMSVSRELGTRHRAALGVSEMSDSLTVIVSEETGTISIAEYGTISRHLDIETLEKILWELYTPEESDDAIVMLWRKMDEKFRQEKK